METGHAPHDDLLGPAPRTPATQHLLAVAVYLVVATAMWSHVWIGGNPAHAITCNCGDTSQQVWWLEWFPWALSHGHNPFLTNAMWARLGGVNALTNTSWMAPAALLWPVTALYGPVASFNVANLLAPVVSGWAAFALAGRFRGASSPAWWRAPSTRSRPTCCATPSWATSTSPSLHFSLSWCCSGSASSPTVRVQWAWA